MKAGLIVSAVFLTAASALSRSWPVGGALPPLERPAMARYAVQDISVLMAGFRRFGGDLAYIEFLQYLGGSDGVEEGHDHAHDHGAGHAHAHDAWLPKTLPLASRVVVLSPFFHAAHLMAAGALGFVLDRPAEALSLLAVVSRHDPTFWRYRLYAGAIAYRRDESPDKVIPLLEEALKYPDCPSILQNILGNLHKKMGNYRRAADIYEFTALTSKDPYAVETARRHLAQLRAEGRIP